MTCSNSCITDSSVYTMSFTHQAIFLGRFLSKINKKINKTTYVQRVEIKTRGYRDLKGESKKLDNQHPVRCDILVEAVQLYLLKDISLQF